MTGTIVKNKTRENNMEIQIDKKREKDPNLIDKKEYRKRYAEFFQKFDQEIKEMVNIPEENTLSWGSLLERNAIEYSDNVALKFENTVLTYKEFNENVNRYANYFISIGLKKGDCVVILMTNRTELLTIYSAVSKIGAISSMINYELRKKTLIHCISLTPGKLIVLGEECYDTFNDIRSELELSETQKFFFVPDQGTMTLPENFTNLPEVVRNCPVDNPSTVADVHTSDPMAYIFTSGTTGLPKAAILIHYRTAGYGLIFGQLLGQLTPNDTIYICLPFFHGTALMTGWSAAMGTGGAVAVGRKFSSSRFWDEIRKYEATAFSYVGEICRYLMNQPPNPEDLNNSVRAVIGNGLRPEIWVDFKKRFNIEKIGEFYGASEGNGGFANILNFDCTTGTTTGSYVIVKYDIENNEPIRNEKGYMQKVKRGETGLLLIESEGPGATFRGYTDKKATETKIYRNVLKQGDEWFNTGDLMRDQGCSHAQFVDRLGDTYRWKGHNISTTEVEEVLNVNDQVGMSCVYGIQIPLTDGRAGMATIVPISSIENFNFKELAENFRQNLADYAIPIFLRFKSEISVTSTFKFKKEVLKIEGFDIDNIDDMLYVLLPNELDYQPLTKEIYDNILHQKYKF